ncbi:PadR family transcriptional regulator [Cohnella abietis]|uniref:PadR family transcriptional regulator n=1 Tax=Cohnella abietis TaxID=2507935 RepID=A0A3T1D7L2_9BACL|nr:PadR family transcriptional regulator [Cohnella abietis]BBI34039.1 PadR family transcriptional regulator [Cohnella abietis]
MNTQHVILGLLKKRSFTGYEMKNLFETVFSFFFDASFGTIYPALSKMEQLGYITKESIVQDKRPNKNVYTITPAGIKQFAEYMNSPVEKETVRSDFLMRMFFGEFAQEEASINWIKEAIASDSEDLEKLEAMKRSALAIPIGFSTKLIGLEIGIETTRARLKVLQESLLKLIDLTNPNMRQGDQQ